MPKSTKFGENIPEKLAFHEFFFWAGEVRVGELQPSLPLARTPMKRTSFEISIVRNLFCLFECSESAYTFMEIL